MKVKKIYEEFSIIIGAIIIGIPLGLFVGIVCWIKFPFAVYREARAKLAIRRIQEAKEFLEKHGRTQKTQDIWENIFKEWKKKNIMTIENVITMLEETTNDLKDTLRRKSSDYTGGEKSQDPFANFRATEVLDIDPIVGIMMRIMDKIQRIRSFTNDGELKVSNESVYDAFDDIIGYTVLAKAMTQEKRQKTTSITH